MLSHDRWSPWAIVLVGGVIIFGVMGIFRVVSDRKPERSPYALSVEERVRRDSLNRARYGSAQTLASFADHRDTIASLFPGFEFSARTLNDGRESFHATRGVTIVEIIGPPSAPYSLTIISGIAGDTPSTASDALVYGLRAMKQLTAGDQSCANWYVKAVEAVSSGPQSGVCAGRKMTVKLIPSLGLQTQIEAR